MTPRSLMVFKSASSARAAGPAEAAMSAADARTRNLAIRSIMSPPLSSRHRPRLRADRGGIEIVAARDERRPVALRWIEGLPDGPGAPQERRPFRHLAGVDGAPGGV